MSVYNTNTILDATIKIPASSGVYCREAGTTGGITSLRPVHVSPAGEAQALDFSQHKTSPPGPSPWSEPAGALNVMVFACRTRLGFYSVSFTGTAACHRVEFLKLKSKISCCSVRCRRRHLNINLRHPKALKSPETLNPKALNPTPNTPAAGRVVSNRPGSVWQSCRA